MMRAAAVVVAMLITSCRADIATTLGLARPEPGAPVEVDFLCDRSAGSTCTPARLQAAMQATVPSAMARPGSKLRLWDMGSRLEATQLIASAKTPALLPNARHQERAAAAFERATIAQFVGALGRHTVAAAPTASPIAASVTRIAWAGSDDHDRLLVLLTDGREFSRTTSKAVPRIDLECGTVDPVAATAALQADGILTPKALSRTDIVFAFVSVGPVDGDRCPASLARTRNALEFWRTGLAAAGARSITYSTDSITLPPTWRVR